MIGRGDIVNDPHDPRQYRLDSGVRPLRLLWLGLAGMALMVVAGCGALRGAPLGYVTSSGGLLGTWSASAYRCGSGIESRLSARSSFVYFKRAGSFELSTGILSGETYVWVQRYDPFREIDIARESCRRFEVRHVPQPDGRLGADVELDCDTGDRGRITASFHVRSCS